MTNRPVLIPLETPKWRCDGPHDHRTTVNFQSQNRHEKLESSMDGLEGVLIPPTHCVMIVKMVIRFHKTLGSGFCVFAMACTPSEMGDTGHWVDGIEAQLISSGFRNCERPNSARSGRLWPADGGDLAHQAFLEPGNSTDPADSQSQDWGMAVADFDQDGHLDVDRSHLTAGNLYFGDGSGNFQLAVDGQVPLNPANKRARARAIPTDVDGDGDMDLTISRSNRTELLLNDGSGRFIDGTDILPISNSDGQEFAVSWADYDLDGDLDLFLPRYPQGQPNSGSFRPGVDALLYENRGSKGFVDVSERLPEDTNDGYPFVGGWHDLDLDGRPICCWPTITARNRWAWRNQTDGFVDVSNEWGLNIAIDAMGMAAGDFNRDGRPDLPGQGGPNSRSWRATA